MVAQADKVALEGQAEQAEPGAAGTVRLLHRRPSPTLWIGPGAREAVARLEAVRRVAMVAMDRTTSVEEAEEVRRGLPAFCKEEQLVRPTTPTSTSCLVR